MQTPINKFRKTTDVQATWREFGWTPPGDDPYICKKWAYFRKLDTEQDQQQPQQPQQPQQTSQESSHV